MNLNKTLPSMLVAFGILSSTSAYAAHEILPATTDVWDTAAPWAGQELYDFAGWSFITNTIINGRASTPRTGISAPDDEGSGQGTLISNNTYSLFTGGGYGGNIYSWVGPASFTATLTGTGNVGDVFDVYVRMSTVGLLPTTTMTLNGVAATSSVLYYNTQGYIADEQGNLQPSAEQEVYWLWENVSSASLYSFVWSNTLAHVSLDQIQLATVLVTPPLPVPEPSAYAMLALGLGVLAAARRRTRQST